MAYRNLHEFIDLLEREGELIRIHDFVDPRLEIAEVTDRVSKMPGGGKALLFEQTGTDFPVLINALGSQRRMCLALGVQDLDDISREIEDLFKLMSKPKESILDKLSLLPKLSQFASWMPKVISGKGACQQVVWPEVDLNRLPVLTCWPRDGGPFVTLPVIHTKDPVSGIRNVGMYRMQVFEKDMTGMHWHKHKVSARHFNEYKKLGKRMPVAVTLGGDPVYTYAATAPLPDNVDEYMLAGFLRKRKVELVRCLSQPELEVPADADLVIEGYVDPEEDLIWEGPFGDHTGYYSLPDWYPRFHVTCVTQRNQAVYPCTIVGIPPQEDAWIGKATERIFLAPIKMTMVPEIMDMEMPVEGVFHNLVIAQIHKDYAGQATKVMNAMWGAGQMMFNKILVVTDQHAQIRDYAALAREVLHNLDPASDVYFSQGPMDVLDHSCSKTGFGGKMCVDGTRKLEEEGGERPQVTVTADQVEAWGQRSREMFPEIREIHLDLWEQGIPCVLMSVEKNRKDHLRNLHEALMHQPDSDALKMVLYLEHTVPVHALADALWRFCNNVDPRRDHVIYQGRNRFGEAFSCLGLDGTRKTLELDGFSKDWPNIITASIETIRAVDAKWDRLGLGPFQPSPSLRYLDQRYGEEAAVR